MGHNESNTRRLNEARPGRGGADRPQHVCDHRAAHRQAAPKGWLSSGLQETWDTLDHLVDNGCEYVADWCNDDQPYQMTLDDGRTIVSMPYTQQLNDKSAIERRFVSADGFSQMICDQFDVLYKEGAKSGRVMAIALHPYLIGVPHRIGAFDAALKYICKHKKVWKATGSEIASHYLAQLDGGTTESRPRKTRGRRTAMKLFRTVLAALLLGPASAGAVRRPAPPTT